MSFADLKRNLLAPALVGELGEPVTHVLRAGGSQEDLLLVIHAREEIDDRGDRFKRATGQTSDFDDLPVAGDYIDIGETPTRYRIKRVVDDGGILSLDLEATNAGL